MAKSKAVKSTLKALGIKQEQPDHLKGLAAKGAGKATRYKPGDERLKNNQGQRKQIVPARNVLKARARVSEILKELQGQPIAKELSNLLGLPEDTTIAQAVAFSLIWQALQGDVNAIKHLQLNVENLRDGVPTLPAGPPPVMKIVLVKPNEQPKEPPTIEATPTKQLSAPFADNKGDE
ncbi:MAG TPA: hypothetical protein VNX88_18640 [Terriglobales bacterium]|jgi:hypothetical protein|nr:hypothetical protein [Terriglobales bacterium]